jgi:hypothetical protein
MPNSGPMPRRPPVGAWLPELNKRSEALFEKYPDLVRPYTEADRS